ncbi:hypothetical protein RQP46_011218 [Phenoliferia psychrophenolica]
MATIDSLAPELLSEIFGHLLAANLSLELRQAPLVCRRWREPAQRALFQTVVLRSQRQADLWLQSPARPRYRIKTLHLDSYKGLNAEVLEASPGLSSLILGRVPGGGHSSCVGEGSNLVGLESLSVQYPELFPPNPAALGFSNLRDLEVSLPTLQNIVLTRTTKDEVSLSELLRITKNPNVAGLRRLEIPMVSKDELAGETGLALLDECEERSISLLCRYGYLTRDMMEEASPVRN